MKSPLRGRDNDETLVGSFVGVVAPEDGGVAFGLGSFGGGTGGKGDSGLGSEGGSAVRGDSRN